MFEASCGCYAAFSTHTGGRERCQSLVFGKTRDGRGLVLVRSVEIVRIIGSSVGRHGRRRVGLLLTLLHICTAAATARMGVESAR